VIDSDGRIDYILHKSAINKIFKYIHNTLCTTVQ